jgi:hypothetical protein
MRIRCVLTTERAHDTFKLIMMSKMSHIASVFFLGR